jgi:Xaa-Pro aminopeptidase
MTDSAQKLKRLREEIAKLSCDGFIVPMSDEYQSEYVPPSAQRIAFLSGFTGSAGVIIVLQDKAAFFTDGRYTLQASQQVSTELFQLHDSTVTPPSEWLIQNIVKGAKIGFDPWLHTAEAVERLKKAVVKSEAELVAVERNPVDVIWQDRPKAPTALIYAYDNIYAGKTSADKRAVIAADLKKHNLVAAVISDPASVAWLLNVRGNDVANTPLPLSFAIIYDNGRVKWFVDPAKITGGLELILGAQIDIEHPGQFPHALDRLGSELKAVRIDGTAAASWIVERLRAAKAKLDLGQDPCVFPKACKNSIEIDGMRAAHRRDGAALARFFAWLEANYAKGNLTELIVEEKLSEFRSAHNLYRGPSFDTIAGAGPHGAIVHYRATAKTSQKLETGQIFLLDSGGQYLDGTTDVTRTVILGGNALPEVRDRFTRVLKGHIALASIRFPEGTSGSELDALARQYLWAIGLDYNHGTGHGVGNYLGVHEGPQAISRRNTVALKPGMVVSNEPGFYKNGHYGIRIENLQTVVQILDITTTERKMLGFESLTLVPIDRRLIDIRMLTETERDWLNTYHARVRDAIRPQVDSETARWLDAATLPL